MSNETDLTDYVNVGAKAHIESHTALDWNKIPDISAEVTDKNDLREWVLPIVAAVIEAYKEANPKTDLSWLDGIG
jgi:hypothetical protein